MKNKHTALSSLNLNSKCKQLLVREGILSSEDLLELTEKQILSIQGITPKIADELLALRARIEWECGQQESESLGFDPHFYEVLRKIESGAMIPLFQTGLSNDALDILLKNGIDSSENLVSVDNTALSRIPFENDSDRKAVTALHNALVSASEAFDFTARKSRLLELLSEAADDPMVCREKEIHSRIINLQEQVHECEKNDTLPNINSLADLYGLFVPFWKDYIFEGFDITAFRGIRLNDYLSKMPSGFTEELLKSIFDELVAENKMKLVVSRYSPIVPGIKNAISELEDSRSRKCLEMRLNGAARKDVGVRFRISVSEAEALEKQAMELLRENHKIVSEDLYAEFYQKYQIDQTTFCKLFGTEPYVFIYLWLNYPHGTVPFVKAADDRLLPGSIRFCIEPFLKEQKEDQAAANAIKKVDPAKSVRSRKSEKTKTISIPSPGIAIIRKQLGSEITSRRYRNLLKKISKSFDQKFYIGDIVIRDDEYDILKAYTTHVLRVLMERRLPVADDPVLAVTLVQIGIKRYDGNYWSYVSEELGIKVEAALQKLLGDSFINTLKAHEKKYVSESERVATILFHGFVSNYFSKGLFALLFQYYVRDLDRDINRNNTEQMNALMDTLAVKAELSDQEGEKFTGQFMEKGSKAYKLTQHTLQAISANRSHSSMRLRRLLRLIDNAFWKNSIPKNPTSRLTILFKQWVSESDAFRDEFRLYQEGEIRNRGKKHFSAPYLFAKLSSDEFSVVLPSQIIRESWQDGLSWVVTTDFGKHSVEVDAFPAVTGMKTEERRIGISTGELFGNIVCELRWGNETVRKFSNLQESEVRFFDMDGDYASKLFKIPMVAYSAPGAVLSSPALSGFVKGSQYTQWEFDFEYGDLVILPHGKSMMVGENYEDGLMQRGRVKNAFSVGENGNALSVYSRCPDLLLTIEKDKLAGTILTVNGAKYRLSECTYTDFDAGDAKGKQAFFVPVSQFKECRTYAENQIILDVPGAVYAREYRFAYAKDFSADFGGSPYVFIDRGTVTFPDRMNVTCLDQTAGKLQGENGFSFELTSEKRSIPFQVEDQLTIELEIPVFMWSYDGATWSIDPMGDIWHTDFFKNRQLFMRSPERKITLRTDSDIEDDSDDEQQSVKADARADGTYVLDLTRFRSWITKEKISHFLSFKIGSSEYDFANVFAKSYIVSCELSADYDEGVLNCIVDAIGRSDIYVDIQHVDTGIYLAQQRQIVDGKLSLKTELCNGIYQTKVFEVEEDDSGFDEQGFLLGVYNTTLINKDDLSGRKLSVRKFRSVSGSQIYTPLAHDYLIEIQKKTAKGCYEGTLHDDSDLDGLKVQIAFPDTGKLTFFNIGFWDEDEEWFYDFMYDFQTKRLVLNEEPGLKPAVKYRRYRILYDNEVLYYGVLDGTVLS